MPPIGQMTDKCKTETINDHLDYIQASITYDKSGLRISKGDDTVTYGDLKERDSTVWHFWRDKPLIGLYGRHNNEGITQLGFITLDYQCQ